MAEDMLDSLKKAKERIRRIEYNLTEPQLLRSLIDKAKNLGEVERDRIEDMMRRIEKLAGRVSGLDILMSTSIADLEDLRTIPIGAVDGSYQLVGGVTSTWYIMLGASYVLIPDGFGGGINYNVISDIITESGRVDVSSIRREAILHMMLLEAKSLRICGGKLADKGRGVIFLDGPIMDPPLWGDKGYVSDRAKSIIDILKYGLNVVGIAKTVGGRIFINQIRSLLDPKYLDGFNFDSELLSPLLTHVILKSGGQIAFTKPYEYPTIPESEEERKICDVYKTYRDEGIYVYYSYFKCLSRGSVYRVDLASLNELSLSELKSEYENLAKLIRLWTLPGFRIPLPVIIAHDKCRVRRGAAETLYYEIITRGLTQTRQLYLSSLIEESNKEV